MTTRHDVLFPSNSTYQRSAVATSIESKTNPCTVLIAQVSGRGATTTTASPANPKPKPPATTTRVGKPPSLPTSSREASVALPKPSIANSPEFKQWAYRRFVGLVAYRIEFTAFSRIS